MRLVFAFFAIIALRSKSRVIKMARTLREPPPILVILLVALTIRLVGLATQALWYDELQSVTHAALPLPALLTSLYQFDPHPPLYYSQLHLWLRFGDSDLWIKLNSVVWSILTVASLFVIAGNRFGQQVGVYAALAFTLLPFAIAYAQEARMYALLMFLGLWIYHCTDELLHGRHLWGAGSGLVSATLAFLFSHGAGFLICFSTASYAFVSLATGATARCVRWQRFLLWLALQGLILLYYMPWIYRASSINVRHTLIPDLPAITHTLSLLVLGFGELSTSMRWGSVLFAVVMTAIIFITNQHSRSLILSFIVVPVVITLSISYLYRPIWHHRPLAYTVPFLAIMLALAAVKSMAFMDRFKPGTRLRYAFITVVGMALVLAAANQQTRTYYPWQIRAAAQFLQMAARPGDRIYVPDHKVFWGVSWYFIGPGSVDPLQGAVAWGVRNGVTLIASGDWQAVERSGSCNWVLYRTIDMALMSPAPAEAEPTEAGPTGTVLDAFDDLMIAKRCLPGP